jgi:hypothetical protein
MKKPMFDFTLSCMGKGNYVCPPDAGPAWRRAFEAGCDMEELEANLLLTPEERLAKHQRKLDEWFEFEAFMEKINRGRNFLRLQYVHSR